MGALGQIAVNPQIPNIDDSLQKLTMESVGSINGFPRHRYLYHFALRRVEL